MKMNSLTDTQIVEKKTPNEMTEQVQNTFHQMNLV